MIKSVYFLISMISRGGGLFYFKNENMPIQHWFFFSTSFLSASYYRFHRKQFNMDFLTCFLYTTLFTSCTCTLGFRDLHWLRSTNWRSRYFNGKLHEKYKYTCTCICIDYIHKTMVEMECLMDWSLAKFLVFYISSGHPASTAITMFILADSI